MITRLLLAHEGINDNGDKIIVPGRVPALNGSLKYWAVTKTDNGWTVPLLCARVSVETPIWAKWCFCTPFWISQLTIHENVDGLIHSACIAECITPTPSAIVWAVLSQKGVQEWYFLCPQKWHFSLSDFVFCWQLLHRNYCHGKYHYSQVPYSESQIPLLSQLLSCTYICTHKRAFVRTFVHTYVHLYART